MAWFGTRRRSRAAAVTGLAVAAVVLASGAQAGIAQAADPWTPVNPQTPDSQVNVTGTPASGTASDGTVRGTVDAHTHLMSDVGFGGSIVCGKTFSGNGIADALQDCPNHYPNGQLALIENLTNLEGDGPSHTHDPVGWPTFTDWPKWSSLTHQQMYYKWVERAWRGGERIMVADAVNNNVLCSLRLQVNKYSCDDMSTVRRQIAETKKLEQFIDSQYGGAGKGWFRIAYSASEARTYITQGELAVILGVEVSNPFGCKTSFGIPLCSKAQINAGLTELHGLGVRSMFLCHKFDNALCGVRFDEGTQGVIVNLGNFLNTGRWWDARHCDTTLHDNTVATGVIPQELAPFIPLGATVPIYPVGQHCNPKGLTMLGEYALKGMMDRGMVVEVDHMSVKAATRTLDLLDAAHYPGVVSSHSWMAPELADRVYRRGGFIAQYGHDATEFVEEMDATAALRAQYDVGYGYGTDMNGFGGTARPPEGHTISYPFTTIDGSGTVSRQQTGQRSWDYNMDGVAHYGMLPDWMQDVSQLGGSGVVEGLERGTESYLRTLGAAESF